MRDTSRPLREGLRPSPDALLAQARREAPGAGV